MSEKDLAGRNDRMVGLSCGEEKEINLNGIWRCACKNSEIIWIETRRLPAVAGPHSELGAPGGIKGFGG